MQHWPHTEVVATIFHVPWQHGKGKAKYARYRKRGSKAISIRYITDGATDTCYRRKIIFMIRINVESTNVIPFATITGREPIPNP